MIRFSSKKKKKRLSKSLSFSMWVTCQRSKLSLFFLIILSKLSLGKENISCSYAVMPNCGRRSKQVAPHKKKKSCGRRRESINESIQCQFGLRGQSGGVEGSRIELAKNRLILDQFYSTLLYSPSLSLSLSLNPNGP